MAVQPNMHLRSWAICPVCCEPHHQTSCPSCEGAGERPSRRGTASNDTGPAGQPQGSPGPSSSSGVAIGGLTLGALGIVPLLGLVFCLLGVVLSLAAWRARRHQGRPSWLPYFGLCVSLTTAIPGVLLWGWLRAASAAW